MEEGWFHDDYLVLFSDAESAAAAVHYQLHQHLPGLTLVGLSGWDDFILMNPNGAMLTLPTVPMNPKQAVAFSLPEQLALEADDRFTNKVKWYVKPLIFGGDAEDPANLAWVTHEQHAQLVVWWNDQYRAAKANAVPA